MINRLNYESWFVDFLDGKLTGEQLDQLHVFLAKNPDLAAELEEISVDLPLIGSDTAKVTVAKKEIAAVGSLNENSFETAFVAYHENDLSEAEQRELELFLAKNPFLRREFDWFGQLAVTHSGESFPQKRGLKHTVPLPPLYRYAAAASVLLLLGLGAVWYIRLDVSQGGGLAYRPASVRMPVPDVRDTDSYAKVSDTGPAPAKNNPQNTQPSQLAKRVRFETVAGQMEPFIAMESTGSDPSLGQVPALYVNQQEQAFASGGDEMTLVQALGKAIETGMGENSVSSGLKEDRKITPGDMVDLASTPFKKSNTPVLATEKPLGGKRRVKLRLGVFEADFSLR